MANLAQLFATARRYPLGRHLFSRLVTLRAPYFASISPLFLDLRAGHSQIRVRNRRQVHNHLGTVNAIAMCAMCELAAGTMLTASVPANLRWIPRGMTTRYLQKAQTDVVATTSLAAPIPGDFHGDLIVPVAIKDMNGQLVMEADITMYLSAARN